MKIRIKIYNDIFFIMAFIIWYSTEIISSTTLESIGSIAVDKISNVFDILVFLLLLIQIIFFQNYKKKEIVAIVGITVLIIISTFSSGKLSLLSVWMFIVAAKNTHFNRIIRIAYRILLFLLPLVATLRLAGVIDDYIMYREGRIRYSLGFSHPNMLGLRMFQLLMCYFYIHKDYLKNKDYILLILSIAFLILVPNSQTAFLCTTISFLVIVVYKCIEKKGTDLLNLFGRGMLAGTLLFCVVSVFFSYIDVKKYSVLAKLDEWMSVRFSFGHRVWNIYGISMLGQKVYVTEEERELVGLTTRLWLDNAYVSLLIRYGVIILILFIFCYLILMKKCVKDKNYMLAIILFVYSIYGIMENGLYLATHNIFLFAFSVILYNQNEKVKYAVK